MSNNNFERSLQVARQELEMLYLHTENSVWSQALLDELLTELAFTIENLQQQFESLAIARDVAEWERHRYKTIFENSSEAYRITDRWGSIQEANRAAASMLNVPQILLVGKLLSIFIAEAERYNFRRSIIEQVICGKPLIKKTVFLQPWGCDPIPAKLSVTTIYTLGKLIGLCWHIQTGCEREIEKLNHDLLHDSLTGLLNYTGFIKRFEHTLKIYQRHHERAFAVLFIDLDNFKLINDRLGHLAGNFALNEVARRLSSCLREIDTISRFAGDEFLILLEDIVSLEDAKDCASKIQRSLGRSLELNGRVVELKASIGIVISHPDCLNLEEYLHRADLAMYDAKSKGGCGYQVAIF